MVTVFANNQVIVSDQTTQNVIETDPVPMRGSDRVSGILNIHYAFTALGAFTLDAYVEGSNDGQNWVPVTAVSPTAVGLEPLVPSDCVHAFVRMKFEFLASSSNGPNAICFSFHGILDKS